MRIGWPYLASSSHGTHLHHSSSGAPGTSSFLVFLGGGGVSHCSLLPGQPFLPSVHCSCVTACPVLLPMAVYLCSRAQITGLQIA